MKKGVPIKYVKERRTAMGSIVVKFDKETIKAIFSLRKRGEGSNL